MIDSGSTKREKTIKTLSTTKDWHQVPSRVASEWLTLAVLSPLAYTNLRAAPNSDVVAVDASPSGFGACVANVGVKASRELWRCRNKRGAYTWLAGRDAEAARAFADGPDKRATDDAAKVVASAVARVFTEQFDVIVIGGGLECWYAAEFRKAGLRVGPVISMNCPCPKD